MILETIDRWYKLLFCNADLRSYESSCLDAWKKHLSEQPRLKLEGQLARFDYVERLSGEKKVNFFCLRRHRVPFSEQMRFPVSTEEQTIEVATVWLRRCEPRSRARLRADMIVGAGEFFSIEFNKPPLAYFGIDEKTPTEPIIDEVLIRQDLTHKVALAPPLMDAGRLEGWLAEWHTKWQLSEVLEPAPQAEREKLLRSFDTVFPKDYLEAVAQVGSFRVRNCKVFGLSEVEKIVHPDQNSYVIAEVEDRCYVGVRQGAETARIYQLHFESDEPEPYDSTSIRAVLEHEMRTKDD